MLHAIVHFCCINTESEEIYSHDLSLSCTSLHLSLLSCEEEFQSCLLNLGELNKMSEKSSTKWRNVSILHKVQATNMADGDRVNELVGVGVGGQMKGLSLKDIFQNLRRLVILELRCLPCTSTIPRRGTRSLFCFSLPSQTGALRLPVHPSFSSFVLSARAVLPIRHNVLRSSVV